MHIRLTLKRALFLMAAPIICSTALAEVVVIVSPKNPVESMTRAQVADIFLGKRSHFPDGQEAVPVDLPEDASARQSFYASVVGKSQAQLKVHWSRLLFTGKGQPPRELSGADVIKKTIVNNPRYIGYVDKSAVDSGVKIVRITE